MSRGFASDDFNDLRYKNLGPVGPDSAAQRPGLTLSQCSAYVLLYSDFEVALAKTLGNANVKLSSNSVGDAVYYMSTIGSLFSVHAIIITPNEQKVKQDPSDRMGNKKVLPFDFVPCMYSHNYSSCNLDCSNLRSCIVFSLKTFLGFAHIKHFGLPQFIA